MSIDEAIAMMREWSDYDCYNEEQIQASEAFNQLAEWLEELKDYRDKNKMVVRVDCENIDSVKDKIDELSKYAESQYNKALDDFVKFASTMPTVEQKDGTIRPMWLEEMAEKLKAGGENDITRYSNEQSENAIFNSNI